MLNAKICLHCGTDYAKKRLTAFAFQSWQDKQDEIYDDYEAFFCPKIKRYLHPRENPPEECTYILEQTINQKIYACGPQLLTKCSI